MRPPVPHILFSSLATFLNKLALTLMTDLIMSFCFVIVLSDCQRPVPEQSAHSSGQRVGAHLLPFLYCAILASISHLDGSVFQPVGKGRGWGGVPQFSFIFFIYLPGFSGNKSTIIILHARQYSELSTCVHTLNPNNITVKKVQL